MTRAPVSAELVLLRHAPADHGGRLAGRTDVPALLPDEAAMAPLRATLAGCAHVVSSPARRCRMTAAALFPDREIAEDARLWEQDFGAEEGRPFATLPDLGPLTREALAARRPEGGESFMDMAARTLPALMDLAARARREGPVAVIAHAGTARAALGLALGAPALGLAFEIAPLAETRLLCLDGAFAIRSANARLG